jgi:hypothetical protein
MTVSNVILRSKKIQVNKLWPFIFYAITCGYIFILITQQQRNSLTFIPVLAVLGFLTFILGVVDKPTFLKSSFLTLGILGVLSFLSSKDLVPLAEGDVSNAISVGAYSGFSPRANSILWITFQVIFVAVIGLIFWNTARMTSKPNTEKQYSKLKISKNSTQFVLKQSDKLFLPIILIFVCMDVASEITGLRNPTIDGGFDPQQGYTWLFFRSEGYSAMSDYWFPYGGLYTFYDGTLGIFLRWMVMTAIGFILVVLCRINELNKFTTYGIVALFLMLQNFWVVEIRYLFPILALILAVYKINHPLKYPFWFSIPLVFVWWMSPEIAIFCFVVYVLAFGINLYLKNFEISKKTLNLYSGFLLNLLSCFFLLCLTIQNGQLKNFLLFLLNPKESVQYGFRPDISSDFNFTSTENRNFAIHIIIAIFVFATFYSVIVYASNLKIPGSTSMFWPVLLISEYAFFLWQKDLVRGSMFDPIALLLIPLFIFLLKISEIANKRVVISQNRSLQISEKQGIYLTITLVLYLIFTPQNTAVSLSPPQRVNNFVNSSIALLSQDNWEIIFSRNFKSVNDLNYQEIKESGLLTDVAPNDEIFVLGDESSIYRHLQQKPYWTVSIWNASPYSAQQKVLAELSNRKPRFVYLDKRPETLQFDGTPAFLRAPLLYNWVVNNYSMVKVGIKGDLLERTKSTELSLESRLYFNELFGKDLSLGFLPQAMSAPSNCDANSVKVPCVDYLEIQGEKGSNLFNIECRETDYSVSFSVESSRLVWIPLGRLWFYESGCKVSSTSEYLQFLGELDSLY